MSNLITYKIAADVKGRLKAAARVACNFWNRFIEPKASIVIRLGTFTEISTTIAQSYEPYTRAGVVYGVIEFNTKYLPEYSDINVAGTVAHEIGHTLGYGWSKWMKLFDHKNGRFKQNPVRQLPALAKMRVETDYGPGTTLSHWDEAKFGAELMTGIKSRSEHVLPVTIDVAALLGHRVINRLKSKTPMKALVTELKSVRFMRKEQAKAMDLDHFERTPIWEGTYNFDRRKKPLR